MGTAGSSTARHLDRLAAALGALDDAALRRAVSALPEPTRAEIADQLRIPRAAMHLGDALVPLVRRKLESAPTERRLSVAFALTEPVNTDTIDALGARHEDPSRDDMLAVLPAMIERHGTALVTLMLASYAASDARCQAVFAGLLDTDPRFALPDVPATIGDDGADDSTTEDNSAGAVGDGRDGPRARIDDPDREELRTRRKAAKEARRAAAEKERAARAAAAAKRKEARRAARQERPGR